MINIAFSAPTALMAPKTEYKIYAYNTFDMERLGHNEWQFVSAGTDKNKIIAAAKNLYHTKKFEKIEIKKQVYDGRRDKSVVSTFKTFNLEENNKTYTKWIALAIFVAMVALLALELI